MRTYRKIFIPLAAGLLAAGLAGCADSAASFESGIENSVIGAGSGSGELIREKKSFAAESFGSIQVSAAALDIALAKSPDDKAHAELVIDKDLQDRIDFETSIQSGELNLQVREETKATVFPEKGMAGERKLLISLPDKTYERIGIRNQFGNIDAGDLQAGILDIGLDAGEIRLNRVSGEMRLEVGAGNIAVEGIRLDHDLTARTQAGDIDVQLAEAPPAAELDLRTQLGSVTADLGGIQYTESSDNRKAGAIGAGGRKLEASAAAGDISVGVKSL